MLCYHGARGGAATYVVELGKTTTTAGSPTSSRGCIQRPWKARQARAKRSCSLRGQRFGRWPSGLPMCGRGHPALPPCVPIPPACNRARAPRRAQSGRTGWLLRRPKRAAVAELGRAACAVPAGVHLLAAAGEAGGDGAGAPGRRFSRLPPPPPAAELTACVWVFLLRQPPMYRSIHSGTCPPTGSTFCTTNNAYSCGVYNLGGSTDGAPPPPLNPGS